MRIFKLNLKDVTQIEEENKKFIHFLTQIFSRCVSNAECCNLPAHFVCKCKPGFEGDGEVECRGRLFSITVLNKSNEFYFSTYPE